MRSRQILQKTLLLRPNSRDEGGREERGLPAGPLRVEQGPQKHQGSHTEGEARPDLDTRELSVHDKRSGGAMPGGVGA